MVLEKTDEWKKVKSLIDRPVDFLKKSLIVGLVSAGLLLDHPYATAGLLIVTALGAKEFAKIVAKMDFFKHDPDAFEKKIIDHLPLVLYLSACGVALFGF